jgi:hypothetical protein
MLTLAGAMLALGGAVDGAPRRPPPPVATLPQPAPIALAPEIFEAAAAYERYMARAAAISPDFHDGQQIEQSLTLGASPDARALLRGEIAFVAVVALHDPDYVASVRFYSTSVEGRRTFAGLIERDPRYVLGLRGSSSAAGLAMAALLDQGRRLYTAGTAVTQSAYDIQHQPWSKEFVPNRDQRLAMAKAANGLSSTADPAEAQRLASVLNGGQPLTLNAPAAESPYPPVIIRGLALAAVALLGEAGGGHEPDIEPLLTEPASATCMNMAKLDLYQCLAVAKPYYEDIFCLGTHAMSEAAQCVMIDAGAPPPVSPALAQPPTAPAGPPKKKTG